MRIVHRSIGKYSGPVIYGNDIIDPPDSRYLNHVGRAFWLTGQVETGNRLGSVMMADGTGFTIGIDQHIAVYPRELAAEDFDATDDQGGAWALLADLETAFAPVGMLWEALRRQGWYVAPGGTLRWLESGKVKVKNRWIEYQEGDLVHGALIRDEMTPTRGVVTKGSPDWERSRGWAELLHTLTRAPKSRDAQVAFGVKHLCHRVRTRKLRLSDRRRRVTFQKAVYGDAGDIATLRSETLTPHMDLALCVFHSYTVNAPSVAFRLIIEVLKTNPDYSGANSDGMVQPKFALDLLTRLKTKRYGRWNKRWERTRKAALAVGWWSRDLFIGNEAVMSK